MLAMNRRQEVTQRREGRRVPQSTRLRKVGWCLHAFRKPTGPVLSFQPLRMGTATMRVCASSDTEAGMLLRNLTCMRACVRACLRLRDREPSLRYVT